MFNSVSGRKTYQMKNILCFGDSNTWGYIPASDCERYPKNVRWPGVLQTLLGEEYQVIENGLSGRTTCFDDPTWPGRNGFSQLATALESQCPLDLVIVMLGTNDAKLFFPGAPSACGRAMENYAQLIRGKGYGPQKGDPRILVISPVPLGEHVTSDSFDPVTSVDFSRKLGDVYRRYSETIGAHFMDAADFVKETGADGIHLTPEGHRQLAEAVAEKVREILA